MAGQQFTIGNEECAIVLSPDGDGLSVRIETSDEPEPVEGSDEIELSAVKLLGLAIATRLTEDPDFMEEMLDWFDDYSEDAPEA